MIFEGLGVAKAGSFLPSNSAGISSSEVSSPSSSASPLGPLWLKSPPTSPSSVSGPDASDASASRPVKATKRSFLASAIVEY